MFGIKYRYLFIAGLAVYSYLNIIFTEGDRLFGFEISTVLFIITLFLVVAAIWEANHLIQNYLPRISTWLRDKVHPLLLHFGLSVIAICVIAVLSVLLIKIFVNQELNQSMIKLSLGFCFRVNLFLNSINAIVFYMNQLKKTQLEAEQLKKQNAEARFEALRNQINPHFLFNSFNVLSTLVYKDADTSAKFIEQLSNVYRYLLFYQDHKVVKLKSEMEFLESYIYLLKIRFRENLFIEKNVEEWTNELYVAPASLQMLIENAIKHNVVSKKDPLHIKIYSNDDHLIVENNIQPKEVQEASTHIGLKNIKDRYKFLGREETLVIQSNGVFKVKIPLLDLES